MVERCVEDRVERLRCYRHLARWPFVNLNGFRLACDLLGCLYPHAFTLASRVKRRLVKDVPAN